MFPGEVYRVELFGGDPPHLRHVVRRVYLPPDDTSPEPYREHVRAVRPIGVSRQQYRGARDLDLNPELLPRFTHETVYRMFPNFEETAGQVYPALLRLVCPHRHECPAVLDYCGPDRRGGAAIPGASTEGAFRAAARARLLKACPVGWTEPVGLSGGEGDLLGCIVQVRTLTSSSATPASWSTVRTTSTRSQIFS